jgi:hypothetical protein
MYRGITQVPIVKSNALSSRTAQRPRLHKRRASCHFVGKSAIQQASRMKSIVAMAISSTAVTVTAVPDPLITPRAELAPRQTSSGDDPALLGWVDATNGQCKPRH